MSTKFLVEHDRHGKLPTRVTEYTDAKAAYHRLNELEACQLDELNASIRSGQPVRMEYVVIGAKSLDTIKSTHGRYFNHRYEVTRKGSQMASQHKEWQYDVFISHASEDKDYARRLYQALDAAGLKVWFDEQEIFIGDILSTKIAEGLDQSQYGLVILSEAFIPKGWTQFEMSGLITRQAPGREQAILPVWHGMSQEQVAQYNLSLADIAAMDSDRHTPEMIASAVARKLGRNTPKATPQSASHAPVSRFAVFYVSQAGMPEMPVDEVPPQRPLGGNTEQWLAVTVPDQQLEYRLEGKRIRLQLNEGNSWSGDEIQASALLNGTKPFALIARHDDNTQLYYPEVRNTAPDPRSFIAKSNKSGWFIFQIGKA